jgi:hypothetical protein
MQKNARLRPPIERCGGEWRPIERRRIIILIIHHKLKVIHFIEWTHRILKIQDIFCEEKQSLKVVHRTTTKTESPNPPDNETRSGTSSTWKPYPMDRQTGLSSLDDGSTV